MSQRTAIRRISLCVLAFFVGAAFIYFTRNQSQPTSSSRNPQRALMDPPEVSTQPPSAPPAAPIVPYESAAVPNTEKTTKELYWEDIDETALKTPKQNLLVRPNFYRMLAFDITELKRTLTQAPMEFTEAAQTQNVILGVPMPNHTISYFRIQESPIMAPELAAKWSDIKTYSGQGLDNPAATARFDLSSAGFHAMILAPGKTIYIDPYAKNDGIHHISYDRNDVPSRNPMHCKIGTGELSANIRAAGVRAIRNGTKLRTYRLALACTQEYTTYHGSKAGAILAMGTTMNRVNGIYMNDLGIRLDLVANNDLLVSALIGEDGYTNNSDAALLGENQATIDRIIQNANYDIGHVFSTAAGGLAQLGCVGKSGQKARGETGITNPIGDPFDVDYVCHEMGHQFGANHTFNSVDAGSCTNKTREPLAAYEPGSGTTIMGYAAICRGTNVQLFSDPYFHNKSLDEILNYTASIDDRVGVSIATGNTPPEVNAGPDRAIPAKTPFTLTGSAYEPDGDAVTYCWEQYDLGAVSPPFGDSDGVERPLFRSISPSVSSSRTFPLMQDILLNTVTLGEILPAISRTMHFRLTVRDNKALGGAINDDEMVLTVDARGVPFKVTVPNTAVTWGTGTVQTVRWDVGATSIAPINTANVRIRLSINGGLTYPDALILAASTPNNGAKNIIVPDVLTDLARIKIEPVGNIYFDISDVNFTIVRPPTITNNPLIAMGAVGKAFTYSLTATGSAPIAFAAAGLPGGLMLVGDTISGTPTAPGRTEVQITAMNGVLPNAVKTLVITIEAPPMITSALAAAGTVGIPFSYSITASGKQPITYSVDTLPNGLTLSGSVIKGNPSTPGTFNVVMTAMNTVLPNDMKTLVITINPRPTGNTFVWYPLTPNGTPFELQPVRDKNWFNPDNWSPTTSPGGPTPGPGDNAFINTTPGTFFGPKDILVGGGIEVNDLNFGGSNSNVNTLKLSGTLKINGAFTFAAGTIEGGVIDIPQTAALILPDHQFFKTFAGSTVNLTGNASCSARPSFGMNIPGNTVFNIMPGATFDCQTDSIIGASAPLYTTGGTLNNKGFFKKSAGTGSMELSFSVIFNNDGVVDVQTGTLMLSTPGVHTGRFNAAPGAVLSFGTFGFVNTLNQGCAITGDQVQVGGARLKVIGDLTADNLIMSGGSRIDGPGTLTILGRFDMAGTQSGTGVTNVASTGTLTVVRGTTSIDTRTFNVFCPAISNVTGSFGMSLQNGGTFNIKPGASYDIKDDFGILGYTTGGTINNEGTFMKSVATNNQALIAKGGGATGTLTFNNKGLIDIKAGVLGFLETNLLLDTGSQLTGAGMIDLNIATATIVKDTDVIEAESLVIHAGAILKGPGTLIINNTLKMDGGNLEGTGETIVDINGTLKFTNPSTLDTRTLTLFGTGFSDINATGRFLNFMNGGVFNIYGGTFDLKADGGASAPTGDAIINNGGTFKKSDSGNFIVQGIFNNDGILDIQTNAANITGDFIQSEDGDFIATLGGLQAGQFSALNVQGNVTLDGRIDVKFKGGFQASLGDRFSVVTFVNRTGFFPFLTQPSFTMPPPRPLFINQDFFFPNTLDLATLAVAGLLPDTFPKFQSPPYALPNRAKPGDTISFYSSATDISNSVISYQWTFGDGVSATGPNVTHVYAAPGVYPVQIVASNAAGTVGAAVVVIIESITDGTGAGGGGTGGGGGSGGSGGGGSGGGTDGGSGGSGGGTPGIVSLPGDQDGDGFSDALEIAAGSSPISSSDTPFAGSPSGTVQNLPLSKLGIKLNFSRQGNDSIQLQGTLPFPEALVLKDQKLIVEIAGVAQVFTLNEKGISKSGTASVKVSKKKKADATFTLKLLKGSFASTLEAAGLSNADEKNAVVNIPITLLFNNTKYAVEKEQKYSAKKGKTGSTK